MIEFSIKGGNLGDPDHPCVRVEVEFNPVGELDIFLADENQPIYDLFGNETGCENVMATITRDAAFSLHAWLTEQLYGE